MKCVMPALDRPVTSFSYLPPTIFSSNFSALPIKNRKTLGFMAAQHAGSRDPPSATGCFAPDPGYSLGRLLS